MNFWHDLQTQSHAEINLSWISTVLDCILRKMPWPRFPAASEQHNRGDPRKVKAWPQLSVRQSSPTAEVRATCTSCQQRLMSPGDTNAPAVTPPFSPATKVVSWKKELEKVLNQLWAPGICPLCWLRSLYRLTMFVFKAEGIGLSVF